MNSRNVLLVWKNLGFHNCLSSLRLRRQWLSSHNFARCNARQRRPWKAEESHSTEELFESLIDSASHGGRKRAYGGRKRASTTTHKELSQATPSREPQIKQGIGSKHSGLPPVRKLGIGGRTTVQEGGSEAKQASLSSEQKRALEYALQGRNLFITGSAGVGKSYVVNRIVKELRSQDKEVFITASTGVAAIQVRGQTLHSFAGIGKGEESKEVLADKAARRKVVRNRWRRADVLLIDEMSMIDGELFEKIDYVARICRGKPAGPDAVPHPRPFGGLQLLLVGDFLQLPPVSVGDKQAAFAFESALWEECKLQHIELQRVFRQSNAEFVELLRQVRRGEVSSQTRAALDSLARPLPEDSGLLPTRLYPFRINVETENRTHFKALGGETVRYACHDEVFGESWRDMEVYSEMLDKRTPCTREGELRVGAQVMLLTNMDFESNLVNGSRGVVVGFASPEAEEATWQHRGERKYLSLLRDWAEQHSQLPIVQFASGQRRVIGPTCWDIQLDDGEVTAVRVQMPLALAWAITIHKCQGMTLDFVRMSLRGVFEPGMAYVALSRCRALAGIQLDDYSAERIQADPRALAFCDSLCRPEQEE